MPYIYALHCPYTDTVRYIGKTEDIDRRYREHVNKSYVRITYKNSWIRSVLKAGYAPRISVLEICDQDTWAQVECSWIAYAKQEGWPLTNMTDGGSGSVKGHVQPLEVRQKISASLKGRPGRKVTPEARANMVMAQRRRWAFHQPKRKRRSRQVSSAPRNRRKRANTTSKYFGVHFSKDINKWRAEFNYKNKRHRIGYYDSELQAALYYNLYLIAHNIPRILNIIQC